MKYRSYACLLAGIGIVLPFFGHAQNPAQGTLASDLGSLQGTLDTVFHTMLGYCGELVNVGSGLAGFGAVWYIGYRVWGHLARAEEIDFFPLLRPFAIGLALMNYSGVIAVMNAVLQPTSDATSALVTNSNQAIGALLQQKQALVQQGAEWQMYVGPDGSGSMEKWAQYTGNTDNNSISSGFGLLNWAKFEMAKTAYQIKNEFKVVLSQFLEVLFEAAALCVNTARIFYLVVLAIVGPLVFGLAVFDGFHHVLVAWFAKYVHIFLWLPVCNIFGSIIGQVQVQMIQIDIKQLQAGGQTYFGPTDAAYMVFLLMAVVGYMTVPSVTQFIITVFPQGGAHQAKITNVVEKTTTTTASTSMAMSAQSAAAVGGAVESIGGMFL
jgi:conjugative transposon TraJ protein